MCLGSSVFEVSTNKLILGSKCSNSWQVGVAPALIESVDEGVQCRG